MNNELNQVTVLDLTDAERKTIKRFRTSVFIPFIAAPVTFLIFAMFLPTLLRHSTGITDITGEQFILFLNIPILVSFLPLVIYYYKVHSLIRKHKASTVNPVIMLLLFIFSFFFIILPLVFVIHLWIKSSNLLKESAST